MKSVCSVLLVASLLGTASCLFEKGYIFVTSLQPWADAQTYCRASYTDLASFEAPSEFQGFLNIMQPYFVKQNWIGLSKAPNTTSFDWWSDGTPVTVTYWNSNQPTYLNTRHCVNILSTGAWATNECTKPLPFICYDWYPRVILVNELKTWKEALRHCRTFYTDLISLNTENDFSVFSHNKYFDSRNARAWTGLRFMNGLWFWVNGDALESLVQLLSCPASPFHCGALVIGTANMENRDCMEKMQFACYHKW